MARQGDWLCTTCNFRIHGYKTYCSKCNTFRNMSTQIYGQTNIYERRTAHSDRFYDWTCPKCKHFIYGSKRFCIKCKIRNPHLPIDL